MEVRFWGTRGSVAAPGPETVRYGGNTSCVEVRSAAGTIVVVDCGTGARPLGRALLAESERAGVPLSGHVLIGHTHWDHIQGVPFFAPLFQEGAHWRFYGPRGLGSPLADTLAGQMQYTYFPISLDHLEARVEYHDLVEGRLELDDVVVTTQYLNHPALTLGYRLEVDGRTLVYASDHEPHESALAGGGDLLSSDADARHVSFLAGADVVIHDAQYLASEYPDHVGWGHSTVEYVLDAARLAGVGHVVLHHHDPARTDDEVDALLEAAQRAAEAAGYEGEVSAAREGSTIDLPPVGRPSSAAASRRSAVTGPAIAELPTLAVLDLPDEEVLRIVRSAVDAESLDVATADHVHRPGERVLLVADLDAGDGVVATPDGVVPAAVLGITRGAGRALTDVQEVVVWPSTVAHVRTKLRAAVLRRACRWEAAAMPADEESRLEALHALELLDTPPEDRFDRLTALACRVLDVPISLVTLIDRDRQWFKSRQGVVEQESARDLSLCAHAILGDDVFHIPDLLLDARFADNPAVVADAIRSYAGVPLTLPDGSRVGTFCVADRRPRLFDDAQLAELRRIAALAEVELRR